MSCPSVCCGEPQVRGGLARLFENFDLGVERFADLQVIMGAEAAMPPPPDLRLASTPVCRLRTLFSMMHT